MHNLHTPASPSRRSISTTAGYVPDALAAMNYVMRDYRTGEVHEMQPELFDLWHTIRDVTESRAPFQIISGYRSPCEQRHAARDDVRRGSEQLSHEGYGVGHPPAGRRVGPSSRSGFGDRPAEASAFIRRRISSTSMSDPFVTGAEARLGGTLRRGRRAGQREGLASARATPSVLFILQAIPFVRCSLRAARVPLTGQVPGAHTQALLAATIHLHGRRIVGRLGGVFVHLRLLRHAHALSMFAEGVRHAVAPILIARWCLMPTSCPRVEPIPSSVSGRVRGRWKLAFEFVGVGRGAVSVGQVGLLNSVRRLNPLG